MLGDVHKKTVLAYLISRSGTETRTFGTMTADSVQPAANGRSPSG